MSSAETEIQWVSKVARVYQTPISVRRIWALHWPCHDWSASFQPEVAQAVAEKGSKLNSRSSTTIVVSRLLHQLMIFTFESLAEFQDAHRSIPGFFNGEAWWATKGGTYFSKAVLFWCRELVGFLILAGVVRTIISKVFSTTHGRLIGLYFNNPSSASFGLRLLLRFFAFRKLWFVW